MPIIDRAGRVFALVHIIDLLMVMIAIGIITIGNMAGSQRYTNGPLTATVAVAGLAGLVLASKWYHGISWETARTAIHDAKPSRPSLQGVRHRLTDSPDSDVIVIDLRETITVGPIITTLDRILAGIVNFYRDSVVESSITAMKNRFRRIGDRTGISGVIARFFSVPSPPETNYDE